ncbi:hypothetical protein VPH35_000075 [Triticum aestivum]
MPSVDMDSLLASAALYTAELRTRVASLEEESRQAAVATRGTRSASGRLSGGASFLHHLTGDDVVEVRMMGRDGAAVHMTTAVGSAPHAPAWLMSALRSLELQVQHACVIRVEGVTVQAVVVEVPEALQHEDGAALRLALLQQLEDSASPS